MGGQAGLIANAAMRAIVRRDTGEDYNAFLTRLAKASGIETPTAEELARLDRKRKKKMSNEEWTHPHDPDSKIAKMKDGSTRMAHKVEHAVDLGTGAVVGLTLQGAEKGDTETVVETAVTAAEQVEAVLPEGSGVAEMVGDKGYHSNETMVGLAAVGVRSYISEPDRGRRSWEDHPEARDPEYGNRRRIRGKRGRRLLRVVASLWSGHSRMRMKRAACGGCTCGVTEHSEAPAGARGGTQPRAASAPSDRGRHAPEPAGAGFFRHLRSDRASDRPLGASDGFLGRQLAAGGSRRLNRSSPSRLNWPDPRPDFFHGLPSDEQSCWSGGAREGRIGDPTGSTSAKRMRSMIGTCASSAAARIGRTAGTKAGTHEGKGERDGLWTTQ